MYRLTSVALGFALGLCLVVSYIKAAEKRNSAKPEQVQPRAIAENPPAGEAPPRVKGWKPRTEEELRNAHWTQEGLLQVLEGGFKSYELALCRGVQDDPRVRAMWSQGLVRQEENIREVFQEILDLDANSKATAKAKELLKKFEALKKYGPTM